MSWRRGEEPGTLDLLDDGVELMTRSWSAVGVLWVLALPARAALALLLALAVKLGELSELAGPTFLPRSYLVLVLGIATVHGRLVLLQAYRRARTGPAPARWSSLRVPPGDLARGLLATLVVFLLLCAISPTLVLPPFLLPALGLASVAAAGAGPGWRHAIPATFAGYARPGRLAAVHGLLLLGWLVATLNLHLLVTLGAEAVVQLFSVDPAGWVARLSFRNPDYVALLLAGSSLCIEPLWLAVLAVHRDALRARSSGEDLRWWFEELRRQERREAA